MSDKGKLEKRLSEMPTEEDWDSYGGRSTTDEAKQAVLAFGLVPNNRGGVQLHWKDEEVYVEFGPDGEVCGIGWESPSR